VSECPSARIARAVALLPDLKGGYRITLDVGNDVSTESQTSHKFLTLEVSEHMLISLITGVVRISRFMISEERKRLATQKFCASGLPCRKERTAGHTSAATVLLRGTTKNREDVNLGLHCPDHRRSVVDFSREARRPRFYELNDLNLLAFHRRYDLCEFLWRRLRITDEDAAHQRPAGFLQARRMRHLRQARNAFHKFESWFSNIAPSLRRRSAARLIHDTKRSLIQAADDQARKSILSLVLVTVPCDQGTGYSVPWLPFEVDQVASGPISGSTFSKIYAARFAFDSFGDFCIAISRSHSVEVKFHATLAENIQMAQEEALLANLRTIQAPLSGKLGTKKASFQKNSVQTRRTIKWSKKFRAIACTIAAQRPCWQDSKRKCSNYMEDLVQKTIISTLENLCIREGRCSYQLVLLKKMHAISWPEFGVPARRPKRMQIVNLKQKEESWSWWNYRAQARLISQHVVQIPV